MNTTNNDITFFKLWRNIVIRNEIFKYLRIMEKVYNHCKGLSSGFNDVTLKYFKYPEYLTVLKYESQAFIGHPDLFDYEMKKKDGIDSLIRIKNGSIIPIGIIPNSIKELNIPSNVNLLIGSIPSSVESLIIGTQFEQTLKPLMLPNSINTIYIGPHYRAPFGIGVLPCNLKHLVLGEHYYTKLEPGVLPSSLEILDYNYHYSHNIEIGSLPSSLTYIKFSTFFNSVLPVGSLHGTKLKHIKFGCNNTGKLLNGVFPDTVEMIEMAEHYKYPIQIGLFQPSISLKSLIFGFQFNSEIEYGSLPLSLEFLKFYGPFNQELGDISYLINLRRLIFGENYNKPLNHLPTSLEYLNLGRDYSQSIEPGQLSICKNLKYLSINSNNFKKNILVKGSLPNTLDNLSLTTNYENIIESLENEIFPITLESLVLSLFFNLPITKSLFNFNCYGDGCSSSKSKLKSLKLGGFNQKITNESLYLLNSIENLEFGYNFIQEFPNDFKFPTSLKQLTILNSKYNHKFPTSLFTNTSLISLKLQNKDYSHLDSIPSKEVIIFLNGKLYNTNNNYSSLLLDEINNLNYEIKLPEPHLKKPILNLKTQRTY